MTRYRKATFRCMSAKAREFASPANEHAFKQTRLARSGRKTGCGWPTAALTRGALTVTTALRMALSSGQAVSRRNMRGLRF